MKGMSYLDKQSTESLVKEIEDCGYESRRPGKTCNNCEDIRLNLTLRGYSMAYPYTNTESNALMNKVEKYVVMTTGGSFQGSWVNEKDALFYIKQNLKNKNNTNRYLICECKKEVGTKSPEIEIEEIK